VKSRFLLSHVSPRIPLFLLLLIHNISSVALAPLPDISGLSHLLNVVVAQCASILQLLAGEDQSLLVWWNSLLVLDLGLHIVDGVRGLNLEGDGLSR